MTRRKPGSAETLFQELRWNCAVCDRTDGRTQNLGVFIRTEMPDGRGGQVLGYGQLGDSHVPAVVDPSDGHKTLMATCAVCLDLDRRFTPRVRWERVVAELDDMAEHGEVRRPVFWT